MFYNRGGFFMKNYFFILLMVLSFSIQGFGKSGGGDSFSDAEANFKLVMEKLLNKYIDKNISKENLYRAATAGMLSSLNSGEETWNKLLTPRDLREMEIDLSGKVTGIGVTVKFDDHNGYGIVLNTIPGSPAEKAGLKTDDQILTANGKKFKGKKLVDLCDAIRGETGQSVELRVLREDKILTLSVKRESVPVVPVEFEKVDKSTALLAIGFFNQQTPKLVEAKLKEVNQSGIKNLIVDVRDNDGGGFDQAVHVAELFLPNDAVVASTKDRDGNVERFKVQNSVLDKDVQIILLTNKGTFCGAEMLVAALKENKKVRIVGETTFGKWNAQSVETLSNDYAIKYTVEEFQSPLGNTFQGLGIKPDLEVSLPKDTDVRELRSKYDLPKRIGVDLQLKAALELIKLS
jgi:carboxyl-terminal processing protease